MYLGLSGAQHAGIIINPVARDGIRRVGAGPGPGPGPGFLPAWRTAGPLLVYTELSIRSTGSKVKILSNPQPYQDLTGILRGLRRGIRSQAV